MRTLLLAIALTSSACVVHLADDSVARTQQKPTAHENLGVGVEQCVPASAPEPAVVRNDFACKLLSNSDIDDETANHVQTRFNVHGADLGISVVDGRTLTIFFGDTFGYRSIWPPGEDPDSVARVHLSAPYDVHQVVDGLCNRLDFAVTTDVPSVSHDASVARDFAGAYMRDIPANTSIGDFIREHAGPFTNMPGTFEVPSGALAKNGALYVFYAGLVETSPRTKATRSYLARWSDPEGAPGYTVLRALDDLDGGALGGHFIQIAPVDDSATSGFIYLFGSGDYRRSGVTLARVPAGNLESGADTQIYDASTSTWLAAGDAPAHDPALFAGGVGELSVQKIAGEYVALYQRELHDPSSDALVDNRIVVRTAYAPEGPWSDAVTVADMSDARFRATFCCASSNACGPSELLHCDRAGLYASYLVPVADVDRTSGVAAVPYLVSTWDPYDVAVFTLTLKL